MKEQELQTYEPFWNHWQVSENGLLGEGSFGAVFRIQREEFGSIQYAALKVISIPKSQGETKSFENMGMTRKEIQRYYYGIVQEIYGEIELMAMLKGKSNIVSYEDYEIRERQDAYGYHILIRMELATALADHVKERTLQTEEILRMGKDLCQALIECQKHNILHRDIKPANIFVSKDGDFKLGDFGVAKIAKEHQIGVSITGSYSYMAPEIYFGKTGDARGDIYSLALVLYSMSNHTLPFYQAQEKRQMITYAEQQEALQRRLAGEQPPLPEHVPENLGRVIVKALAFEPEQRYADAEGFYQALCQTEMEIREQVEPEQTERLVFEQTVALHLPITRENASWDENTVAQKCGEYRRDADCYHTPDQIEIKQHCTECRQKTSFPKMYLTPVVLGVVCIEMIVAFWKPPKADGHSPQVEVSPLQAVVSESSVYSTEVEMRQTTGSGVRAENIEESGIPLETKLPEKTGEPEETQIPKIRVKIKNSQTSQEKSKTESKTESEKKSKTETNRTVEITERPVVATARPSATYKPTKEPVVYAERMIIPKSLQLIQGNSATLPLEISPANAVYSIYSSNGSVASVNGRTIRANMAGSCRITVKSGTKACSCTVTVTER